MAQNKSDPSIKVAIKVISKKNLSEADIEEIHQEVSILQSLDHPNIVKYYETYEDVDFIYLVMELCPQGELIDKLVECDKISEKDAAVIMEQLLKAIIHCHEMGIAHRDIKPQNIMYGLDNEIKFIDFGLAKQCEKKN